MTTNSFGGQTSLGDHLTAGLPPEFTVSGAIAVFNQVLDTATPTIVVTGEVANFKINQGKWVFFDLKDATGILNCFMPVYQLRTAIEDGMRIKVRARPGITKWGRFSLTIQAIQPVGQGSIKKAFELLKKKLAAEGLFDAGRKRRLPQLPQHIGVISSVDAAGYRDFIKIISARMGGLTIDVISTQVQGNGAADQIIAAIQQFNEMANPPEVLAILRGGGSRDDLSVFDDEKLVRAVAASRIPTISGVGHEVDTTLLDLAVDKRASTPSNAAELLVPDRRELIAETNDKLSQMVYNLDRQVLRQHGELTELVGRLTRGIDQCSQQWRQRAESLTRTLMAYNPRAVLKRGYALVWNQKNHAVQTAAAGDKLTIETAKQLIKTEVIDVTDKD